MLSIKKLIPALSLFAVAVACQSESTMSEDLEMTIHDCRIQVPDGYRLNTNNGEFFHGTLWNRDPDLPKIFQYSPNHSMEDHASKNNIFFQVLSEEQLGKLRLLKVTLEPGVDSGSVFYVVTSDSEFFVTSEKGGSIFLDQFKECIGLSVNRSSTTSTADPGVD